MRRARAAPPRIVCRMGKQKHSAEYAKPLFRPTCFQDNITSQPGWSRSAAQSGTDTTQNLTNTAVLPVRYGFGYPAGISRPQTRITLRSIRLRHLNHPAVG